MKGSLLFLAATLCAISRGFGIGRPYELLIYRDLDTSKCSFVSLAETQIYRGLPGNGYSQAFVTEFGEERLRFIEQYPEGMRKHINSSCGENSHWNSILPLGTTEEYAPSIGSAQGVLTSSNMYEMNPGNLEVPSFQLQRLIGSGPSDNRVDLVFFSDGYTADERDKFIDDANRLAMDISGNQTFNTVKPLLNFWAAFTPSNESGIGTGGVPKDTPFGLYRDGTELRGVYYSKPQTARAACLTLGDKCDYPILMGNDPLYGGLGGEFTVITPSLANGALVLRHELGHSIIEVGEEYDGGYAYFGVNAAHDQSQPIPWSHWFTNSSHTHDKDIFSGARVERSVMPMQAYPWTLLNVSTPWSIRFNSSGTYPRHLVRFSLSGLPDQKDLQIELDGEVLPWSPRPDIGVDRWHYDIHRNESLTDGEHEVKFILTNRNREGVAQLCSSEILEFGDGDEFIATPGHYGIFPTFSDKNQTSFRPTNEDCLMRIVTTPNFCKVCLEGLWLSLLRRVDLIDDLRAGCMAVGNDTGLISSSARQWKRTLDVDLVPLAHLRDDAVAGVQESYTITWMKDGEVMEAFANKTRVEVDDVELALGTYAVDVRFSTTEVRVDKDGLLMSRAEYEVVSRCSA